MGHERLGILPKTRSWINITSNLGAAIEENPEFASKLAGQTLLQVRQRYEKLKNDSGVQAAFSFLIAICSQNLPSNVEGKFTNVDLNLESNPSPLSIAFGLTEWVEKHKDKQEYAELAARAAADTIAKWYRENSEQNLLFESGLTATDVWGNFSGSDFCVISRNFFANLTERYLKYFLERSASELSPDLNSRKKFEQALSSFMNEVSNHAFETSKITQSFAAGWYNKNVKNSRPADKEVAGFLKVAFGKLREEIIIEEAKK
ncbi:hypothetical protein [Leptospira interrogans]|uniref:Uncharacterized protein n=1 Tax=Leptospira interrogans serovar Canicola TaxID=211880 RepID=A0AAP9WE27_LEPIR|nr:hypothetical protein [Leptospira interrogans]QOI43601.1 hypothetical protein Lepto782_15990 [Leptospira interrogans serovar Canicola]